VPDIQGQIKRCEEFVVLQILLVTIEDVVGDLPLLLFFLILFLI